MPSPSVPVELETPRGVFRFNVSTDATYARLEEFTLASSVRSGVEALAGRDGSIVPDSFRNGATPILKGIVTAKGGVTARDDMLEELVAHAVSILRADGILRWRPRGAGQRRMTVRCLEDPQDARQGVLGTFQISLVSRSATSEAEALKTLSTSPLTTSGGAEWEFPFEFPFEFGTPSSGGSVVVLNEGDADALPVVRVYGPIAAPSLKLVETGETLSLPGLVLQADEFAEVDFAAETVLFNSAPEFSLIGKLDPLTSVFFALPPGSSTFVLSGSNFTSATVAEIDFRDTFARG